MHESGQFCRHIHRHVWLTVLLSDCWGDSGLHIPSTYLASPEFKGIFRKYFFPINAIEWSKYLKPFASISFFLSSTPRFAVGLSPINHSSGRAGRWWIRNVSFSWPRVEKKNIVSHWFIFPFPLKCVLRRTLNIVLVKYIRKFIRQSPVSLWHR